MRFASALLLLLLLSIPLASAANFICPTNNDPPRFHVDAATTIQPVLEVWRGTEKLSNGGTVCAGDALTVKRKLTSTWTNSDLVIPIDSQQAWNGLPKGSGSAPQAHNMLWMSSLPSTSDTFCKYANAPSGFLEGYPASSAIKYGRLLIPGGFQTREGDANTDIECKGTYGLTSTGQPPNNQQLQGRTPSFTDVPYTVPSGQSSITFGASVSSLSCISHFRATQDQPQQNYIYSPSGAIPAQSDSFSLTVDPSCDASCDNILVTETQACVLPDTPERDNVQVQYSEVPSGSTLQIQCASGGTWNSYSLGSPTKNSSQPVPPHACSYSASGTYTVSARITKSGSPTLNCPSKQVSVACSSPNPKCTINANIPPGQLYCSSSSPLSIPVNSMSYSNAYRPPNYDATLDCNPSAPPNPDRQWNNIPDGSGTLTPSPSLSCSYSTPGTYQITGTLKQGGNTKAICPPSSFSCIAPPAEECAITDITMREGAPGCVFDVTTDSFANLLGEYDLRLYCDGGNEEEQIYTCTNFPAVNCINQYTDEITNACDYSGAGTYTPVAELWTNGTGAHKVRTCTTGGNAVCSAPPSCTLSPASQAHSCTPLYPFPINLNYNNLPSGSTTLAISCPPPGAGSPPQAVTPPPSSSSRGFTCTYGTGGPYSVTGSMTLPGGSVVNCGTVEVNCALGAPAECIDYV